MTDKFIRENKPKNWRQQNRILDAIEQGRLVYNTGRKINGHEVWESTHPETRELIGLKPLTEIITHPDNLEIVKEHNRLCKEQTGGIA